MTNNCSLFVAESNRRRYTPMLKKLNYFVMAAAVVVLCKVSAFADASAYYTIPSDEIANGRATILGIATALIGILAVMLFIRKATKTTNRT